MATAPPIRLADPGHFPLRKVLREDGRGLLKGASTEHLPSPEKLLEIYRAMLTTRILDERMLKLQRQGRVGFVGLATGQEAAIHASAAAFDLDDWIFSALREGGVTVQRGMSINDYIAHMFGNQEDASKGRQMPNHFQCKEVNFPSWSSVLGTQLPHAVGAALAMKSRKEASVCAAYTGDGATSSNGFHSAMNMAAVNKAPVVFIIVDNGWAISVPSSKQTAASSYGTKAKAYGMPGIDVDGNDALASYQAVSEARERAQAGEGPSLVALRTYRLSGHSSSDDPTRYRNSEEVSNWEKRDPMPRMAEYLKSIGLYESHNIHQWQKQITDQVSDAVSHSETIGPPPLDSLVEDVYAEPPHHLRRQVIEALRLVAEKGAAETVEGKFPL